MFIKSLTVAAVAIVAAVSAQNPNHTFFTAPVGTSTVYEAGKNVTFSWTGTCAPPSDAVVADPTKVPVQLVDASNATNTVFKTEITTIDCTKPMGNTYWVVPKEYPEVTTFALRLMFNPPQYSGNFAIKYPGGAVTPPAPSGGAGNVDKPSSGSILTPVLSGAAAFVASVALVYL
ncbi:hypothetical protein BG004_003380 [Podila humilis]|nr:hypothetical protein BG004_003380 [Podila humilis]